MYEEDEYHLGDHDHNHEAIMIINMRWQWAQQWGDHEHNDITVIYYD